MHGVAHKEFPLKPGNSLLVNGVNLPGEIFRPLTKLPVTWMTVTPSYWILHKKIRQTTVNVITP